MLTKREIYICIQMYMYIIGCNSKFAIDTKFQILCIHLCGTYKLIDMFILIRFRNARKTNKANCKVNEIDMYDSSTAKPGKNHLHK